MIRRICVFDFFSDKSIGGILMDLCCRQLLIAYDVQVAVIMKQILTPLVGDCTKVVIRWADVVVVRRANKTSVDHCSRNGKHQSDPPSSRDGSWGER